MFSKIFSKLVDFAGGGMVKTITDTVKSYFPPSMSDKEKAELSLAVNNELHQYQLQLMERISEAKALFFQFTKDMEGTAKDLLALPVIGRLVIFFRGVQRPAWGFFTLYADFMVLSKSWDITGDEQIEFLLIAINILVLGFLFGERAVQNVAPLIERFFGAKREI